jgi:outer membrane protein OmpA-like peptidoglycan-associated protein
MFRRNFFLIVAASLLAAVPLSHAAAQSTVVSEVDRITEALMPRRVRGVTAGQVDTKSIQVVDRLKEVRRTRGLSMREQDELHTATQSMPQLDLEVFFAFNSAEIAATSISTLNTLGEALNRDAFKASTFVIGGHTDRKGTPDYNQSLSDRRAQAVAQYLAEKHKIDPARILASGFGFRKLKVPAQPFADANRRVQIANVTR